MKLGSRICDTCQTEINDDLCRFCILKDVDDNPRVLHFHYFFPCWDFEMFCQKYPNLEFIRGGFDCDEKISCNPQFVKNLQSNLEMWLS